MTGQQTPDPSETPVAQRSATIAPWAEKVSRHVSPGRFAHITRVAELADGIAVRNGFTPAERRATMLAAMLHDVARELPVRELFELAPPRNDVESEHPLTVHGRAGRRIAELWGVADERVLNAIEGHVFGVGLEDRVGMAVYIADVSEPGRNVNADIRQLAMRDLTGAYRRAVQAKVEYLKLVGKPVHPSTLRIYESIRAA